MFSLTFFLCVHSYDTDLVTVATVIATRRRWSGALLEDVCVTCAQVAGVPLL